MGEEEDTLVDFVLSKMGERQPAGAIEEELQKARGPSHAPPRPPRR